MAVLCLAKMKNLSSKNISLKKTTLNLRRPKLSKEKLVKDTLDSSVDTEPINFSFYFKDEISNDVKNVMKMVDEMLINETQKTPSLKHQTLKTKEKEIAHIKANDIDDSTLKLKLKNIYENVNNANVLNWSNMEETEVQ